MTQSITYQVLSIHRLHVSPLSSRTCTRNSGAISWVYSVYEAMLPADHFAHAKGRMEGFSKGYGTTLFYKDVDGVKEMQGKFASYADKFSQRESSLRRLISLSALQPLNSICL